MTTALLEAPVRLFGDAPGRREGHATLGELLDATWTDLQSGTATDCPACHARMVPHGTAGQCTGCGARLT